ALGKVKARNLSGIGLGGLAQFEPDAKGHISLRLEEKPKAVDTAAPGAFAQSWSESWTGFQNSVGAILRGFGVLLPWLAVLGLVLWLVRRWWGGGAKAESTGTVEKKV
ncbi:MAG TPA: DUF4349 domain-containing protein, partial [Planctomycetota bacterium]|nr:DUF4349 domain-containing protein [Planctomycetota bacterium]